MDMRPILHNHRCANCCNLDAKTYACSWTGQLRDVNSPPQVFVLSKGITACPYVPVEYDSFFSRPDNSADDAELPNVVDRASVGPKQKRVNDVRARIIEILADLP